MEDKIISLLNDGELVSRHCTTIKKYNKKNIFDIGVNSVLIENGNDQSIIKRITNEINKLKEKKRQAKKKRSRWKDRRTKWYYIENEKVWYDVDNI